MGRFFDFAFVPRVQGTERLYFRSDNFVCKDGVLAAIGGGSAVSFDTYFNYIPLEKIRKYTSITELVFCFWSDGGGFVELFDETKRLLASARLWADKEGRNGAPQKLAVRIPSGARTVYPRVRAFSGNFRLKGISVDAEGKDAWDVKCALCFCTYRREESITKNVHYLAKRLRSQTDVGCKIIVVDNARTLPAGCFEGEAILVGNKNSGGSGGFGRGMEEAAKIGGFTHVLLMDDDVELDFVSIQKLFGFLRFLRPEYQGLCVSGSMLYQDNPLLQFEAGGKFGRDGVQKGFGHNLDLAEAGSLLKNEEDNPINYGGWWMMCMPFRYIEEGNYPLPFFLKYDDVEYALRCKLQIVTLNGVGVWHERFEGKYNASAAYYNIRNYLHLCSLYCKDFTKKKAKKIARRQERIRWRQHRFVEAVKLGYEDYLKGLDFLYSLDSDKNHRRICRLNDETISQKEIKRQMEFVPWSRGFSIKQKISLVKHKLWRER